MLRRYIDLFWEIYFKNPWVFLATGGVILIGCTVYLITLPEVLGTLTPCLALKLLNSSTECYRSSLTVDIPLILGSGLFMTGLEGIISRKMNSKRTNTQSIAIGWRRLVSIAIGTIVLFYLSWGIVLFWVFSHLTWSSP